MDIAASQTAELHSASSPSQAATELFAKLAHKHGWTIEEAMLRAVDIADFILDRYSDPEAKIYMYRQGKRYLLCLPSEPDQAVHLS